MNHLTPFLKSGITVKLVIFIFLVFSSYERINAQDASGDSLQKLWCDASAERAIRPNGKPSIQSLPNPLPLGSYDICGNGKFRIIYMDVVNASGSGFDDATLGSTRRNCVCSVVSYIESSIVIPNNIGTTSQTIDIIFNPSINNLGTQYLATAIPVFSAPFYNAVPNPAPGYYGGYMYEYITTGIKPDPNSEDAQVTVNFAYNYTYCTPTIGDCEYDFYSVVLHELTHGLGFLSFGIDNAGVLSSRFGNNVFSIYDKNFLYYDNFGSWQKLFDNVTFAGNNGVNPILPLNVASSNRIWLDNSSLISKQNQPIYSKQTYSAGTSLSHFDDLFYFAAGRDNVSPGYSPNYLMNGSIATHQFKRGFTNQDITALQKMGYTIKNTFPGFANVTNTPPYYVGNLITPFAGFASGYMNTTPASNLSNLTTTSTNGGVVTLDLTTGTMTNGTTVQNLNFIDPDGDPLTVYQPNPGWKGLYNIRGCGSGGNNSNQLNINVARNIITFTPRNNFFGRAQFAFHLYDGKNRGDYVVITVDVSKGSAFVNTPANELFINGNFEEGSELRQVGGNEFNLVAEEINTFKHYIDKVASDGAQYTNNGWNDVHVRNSSANCLFYNSGCFDNCAFTQSALPSGNIGDRYMNFYTMQNGQTEYFNMRLAEPILGCTYMLEADVLIQAVPLTAFPPVFYTNPELRFYFHDAGIDFNVTSTSPQTRLVVGSPLSIANVGVWTHISIPFTYLNPLPSSFVQIDAADLTAGIEIDNLSLVRTSQSPNILVNPIAASICDGQPISLIASGASTYSWSPAQGLNLVNGSNVNANPNSTTTYTVIGTDANGCQGTATSTITVATPIPVNIVASNGTNLCASNPISNSTTLQTSSAQPAGSIFQWFFNNTPISTLHSISVSQVNQSGNYYLQVTFPSGCVSNSNTITVTVNPFPDITLTPSGSISLCGNQVINLNASSTYDPNVTYSWTNSGNPIGTGSNINVNQAGTYEVTATNTITGCVNIASTPVYAAPQSVCEECIVPNDNLEYFGALSNALSNITDAPFWNSPTTVGSPDYYNTAATLAGGVGVPSNTFSSNTPTHSGNGYMGFINYSSIQTDLREYIQSPLNCPMEVNQLYNVSFWARLGNKCKYATNNIGLYLSATQVTGSFNLIGLTPQLNFTTPVPSTAWTQQSAVISGNGEQFVTIGNFFNDASTTTAVVNPSGGIPSYGYYFIDDVYITPAPPSVTASVSGCQAPGTPVTLNFSGSPGYTITDGTNTYTINTPTGSIIVSPLTTTTYTVTPILSCTKAKCDAHATYTINVNLQNVTAIANPSSICSGQSTTLTANGASTYVWDINAGSATTNTVTVSPNSTITYTVTGYDASGICSSNAIATVTVTATPNVLVNSAIICPGASATLTASGANTYTWNTGASTASITVNPSANTNYTVTGTSNGCSKSVVTSVTLNPIPVISATSSIICVGQSVTLNATGAFNIVWTSSQGTFPNGSIVTPTVTTTYTVTGNSKPGCIGSTIATITVNQLPTISATASPSTACSGDKVVLTATGANSYSWSPNVGCNNPSCSSASVAPSGTTTYTVTGTSNGCTNTSTVLVTVVNSINIAVVPTNTLVCQGTPVTLTASGLPAGNNNYTWQASQGSNPPSGNTATVSPQTTTTYTVTGSTGNCIGSAISTVTVVTPPQNFDATIATTANEDLCANNGSIQTFSFNVPPPYTYTWSVSGTNPSTPLTYTVVSASNPVTIAVDLSQVNSQQSDVQVCITLNPCNITVCKTLFHCCKSTTPSHNIPNGATVPSLAAGTYYVSGNVTVNSSVNWNNVNLIMNPSSTIRISQSGLVTMNGTHINACSAMWDGIVISNKLIPGPFLQLDAKNSMIEDAITAIKFTNPGAYKSSINLKNAWFNRNMIGITTVPNGGNGFGAIDLNLDNTVFTSRNLPFSVVGTVGFGTTPPNLTIYPIAKMKVSNFNYGSNNLSTTQFVSSIGIELVQDNIVNANMFTSLSNATSHLFDALEIGILHRTIASASIINNINIQKCTFSNIGGRFISTTYSPAKPINAAVLLNDNLHTNVTIGGANNPVGCDFTNCINGVYSDGATNLTVKRNTFNAPSILLPNYSANGVYFTNGVGNTVNVTNNTINNYRSPIGAAFNTSTNTSIFTNTITNSTAQQSLIRTAITATEFNQPTNAVYYIQNNTISNYTNGVYCEGLLSPTINNNTIAQSNNNTAGNDHAGITIRNCHGSTVLNNTITNTFGASDNIQRTWQYGILGDISPSSYLCGNQINGSDISIKFNGVSAALSNNSTIHNNEMFNANYANFWLDQAGYVGIQGGVGNSSGNKWNNLGSNFIVNNLFSTGASLGVQSAFYYKGNSNYNILSSGTSLSNPGGLFPLGSPYLTTGANNNTCFLSPTPVGGNAPSTTARLIAQDSIVFPANDVQNRFHNKRALLNSIVKKQINSIGDPVLQNFVMSNANSSIGLLLRADTLMNNGITNNDTSIVNNARMASLAFSAASSPETNQQIVNSIFIDFYKRGKTFSATEILELQQIAILCPYTEGTAVFQARSMLNLIDTLKYKSICEQWIPASGNSGSRIEAESHFSFGDDDDVYVFPNPTTGKIFINGVGKVKAELYIYNIQGQLLKTFDIKNDEQTAYDASDLENGSYIFKILQENELIKIGKLIILK